MGIENIEVNENSLSQTIYLGMVANVSQVFNNFLTKDTITIDETTKILQQITECYSFFSMLKKDDLTFNLDVTLQLLHSVENEILLIKNNLTDTKSDYDNLYNDMSLKNETLTQSINNFNTFFSDNQNSINDFIQSSNSEIEGLKNSLISLSTTIDNEYKTTLQNFLTSSSDTMNDISSSVALALEDLNNIENLKATELQTAISNANNKIEEIRVSWATYQQQITTLKMDIDDIPEQFNTLVFGFETTFSNMLTEMQNGGGSVDVSSGNCNCTLSTGLIVPCSYYKIGSLVKLNGAISGNQSSTTSPIVLSESSLPFVPKSNIYPIGSVYAWGMSTYPNACELTKGTGIRFFIQSAGQPTYIKYSNLGSTHQIIFEISYECV